MKNKLYCIPSLEELNHYLKFSEEYQAAFEYNEFFVPAVLDDEEAKNRIIEHYKSTGRDCSEDTLHGAFFDVCINSGDPRIFEVSDLRVHQSMEIARKMGLKAVIFHTNYIVNFRLQSYLDMWLNLNESYWRKILKEYPKQMIYIENMFDEAPVMLTKLAERMRDEPRFAVCLDVAHAMISGSSMEKWMNSLTPYVSHLHINDNDGVEDLHQPVGSGALDWELFSRWGRSLVNVPSILIEVRSYRDLERSVRYMEEKGVYPFL